MSAETRRPTIQLGLEECLTSPPALLERARFGLLMNQASVDHRLCYGCDLLAARFPGQLAVLFSPQHGLWGEEQANMIESPDSQYEPLGVPVYSLYGATRTPLPEMLRELDCLVVDLQDVGTRVYTFVWTVSYCLEACAAAGIPVLVLDRPNPLGGQIVEGPLLEPGFESFVGRATIPLRHGLTLGELARLINRELQIAADLHVVPMLHWQRSMLWTDCDRVWVPPSPNLPRFESALLYPGQVLLEGTNLSEGRGTTMPFELVGAPFLEPGDLVDIPRELTSGLIPVRVRFRPTFDKWQDQSCEGIALRVHDPAIVRSVRLTVAILAEVMRRHPDEFAWLPPPYEYEHETPPIDILFGSDRLRAALASDALRRETVALDVDAWWDRVADVLLYGEQ